MQPCSFQAPSEAGSAKQNGVVEFFESRAKLIGEVEKSRKDLVATWKKMQTKTCAEFKDKNCDAADLPISIERLQSDYEALVKEMNEYEDVVGKSRKDTFEQVEAQRGGLHDKVAKMLENIDAQQGAMSWCLEQARKSNRVTYQQDRWKTSKFVGALVAAGFAKKHAEFLGKWEKKYLDQIEGKAFAERDYTGVVVTGENKHLKLGVDVGEFQVGAPALWTDGGNVGKNISAYLDMHKETIDAKVALLTSQLVSKVNWPSCMGTTAPLKCDGFGIFSGEAFPDSDGAAPWIVATRTMKKLSGVKRIPGPFLPSIMISHDDDLLVHLARGTGALECGIDLANLEAQLQTDDWNQQHS